MAGAAADADATDDVQDHVLGADPRAQFAVDMDRHGLRLALEQALGGQHVTDLGRADAERERAEGTMGGGMAVTADDRHAGLGSAEFGADHMHDAAMIAVPAVQLDAEFAAVLLEPGDLAFGLGE